MTQRLLALFTVISMTVASFIGANAQDADIGPDFSDLETFVDATMETQRALLDISGMTVSIVKDGEVIFAKGYGHQNLEKDIPVTPEKSLFRIGSTSKLFTWTSVMQQVERGNLDLDADINIYLKNFQIPATFDKPITLKHILTHTTGFEEGALGYLISYNPDDAMALADAMAKYVPLRVNEPGAYAAYSNYATALAGLIVQNVTGIPFNEYVKQNIFDPLGMTSTTFVEPLPAEIADNMTVGYKRDMGAETPLPFEVLTGFAPAGSVSSTALDMAKFMMANINNGSLDGAQILKPETAELMHSVLYRGDERLSGIAHGIYEEYLNGHRLLGHGGDLLQFHTNMLFDKDEKLGIFVSYATQTGSKGRDVFIPSFYDYYYPVDLPELTPPADFNERADKYAGEYQFWRHNESTIEKAFALSGGMKVTPTGKNTLMLSGFGEPRQYVEVDTHLFRQVDGPQRIAFGEDENGNIQDLFIEGLPFMDASRYPAFETPFFRAVLPLISILMFVTVLTGWAYRRKEFKAMSKDERLAIRFSLAVAGLNILFLAIFISSMAAGINELILEIPTMMKVSLVLPIITTVLTVGLVYYAVKAWNEGYWRLGRKIHYSLVAGSALYMAIFYYHWNILGFQYY